MESVSYTHLRAHETVLDLVCRLLLEKKKLKNNSSLSDKHQIHTKITQDITHYYNDIYMTR